MSQLYYLFSVHTGPDKFGTSPRLGPDRPCVHTGPPGTGTMWVHLRKDPSTDGPGLVQVSCKRAGPIPLWIHFAFHAQQPKCTCSSRFLQQPNFSINTLWPRLTCFSNLFLNILTFWWAFVFNNKMPFYKHCSNFCDLVNYPAPFKRYDCLEQFWTALVWTLRNGSSQIPKWTGLKFIQSRVNGALISLSVWIH